MKKGWKRILALVLSIALLVGGIYIDKTIAQAATQEMSVASVLNFSTDNGDWRFNLNMNGTWPTSGAFDSYENTNLTVTIKNATGDILATVSGDTLDLYKNGSYWLLCIWGPYTGNTKPAAGDTVTVSSGQMAYTSDATQVVNFAKEVVLEYDGTNWSVYVPKNIQEMSVESVASFSTDNGDWRFHFNMNGTWPTSGAFDSYENTNLTVTIKNAAGDILATVSGDTLDLYKNGSYWLLCIWGAYTGSNAPAAGDTVTVSSGQMSYTSDATQIVNLAEEVVLEYDGSNWSVYEKPIEISYTDITISAGESFNIGTDGDGNPYWDIYLQVNGALPGTNWGTVYSDLVITVNGEEITAGIKRANSENQFNLFIWGSELSTTPKEGTQFTIHAGSSLAYDLQGASIGSGIKLTQDYTLEWNGTTWVAPTVWTELAINGININTSISGQEWQAYFYTDAVLPGEAWGIINNQQEKYDFLVDINGEETTLSVRKAGDKLVYVAIPLSKIPQNEQATLTFKAGKYQSNLQSIGLELKADATFYISEYGWTMVENAITSDVQFTLDVDASKNYGGNGFILNTNVNDGVTPNGDWSARIYPAYQKAVTDNKLTLYFADTNGVTKNDVYQAVNLPLIKLSNHTYYVALADVSLVATSGDYYTIGGTFVDPATGKFIEYDPISVKWTGSEWETIPTMLVDTEILHDVNADESVDAKDLVRIKKYLADASTAINSKQKDINFSGEVDEADAASLRKVLIGLIRYDKNGLVYEIPVYKKGEAIEKMAFSSPSIGTLNADGSFASRLSDTEIDTKFQEYKAAGLTLLCSEYVAVYKDQAFASEFNEPLRVYLEAAARNGLGVIVCSDYLNAALQAEDLANGVYSNWKAVVDHMISNMQSYPAFRGFMMSDELTIAYAANYQEIAGYIHENYPDLLLSSSQLPVTAYKGLGAETLTLDTNTNNTEESAYRDYIWNFASESDVYMYDLYPLVYSEDKIFGITTSSEYGVNDDWYRNLKYVADEVKENNYSFKTGITIQSCKLEGTNSIWSAYERYAPTQKADIGFQVYTGMAYGMQEFHFFTYEDHFSSEEVSNAMADNEQVYAAVSELNAEIDKFAHVFKAFSWKDTLDIAAGSSASTELSKRLTSASATGERVFVGCMKDSDGFDGYMIANAGAPRTAGTATVTLQFQNATQAVVYRNGEAENVTLTDGVCTVAVGAGEGVFVIPIAGVTSTVAADYVDFIVDVPEGREPVVLQLTDTQIIYAEGERTEDRLSSLADTYWSKANKDARCYNYLTEVVTQTNPDLILVTGDLVYGEFDDSGESFTDFVTYMEKLDTPWAPVFGNHEAETALGIDAYCEQLEAAENCLFEQRTLTGNGNYTVGIRQGEKLKRVFFMLDSNGCGSASDASLANGHTITSVGFAPDQIEWYTETAKTITSYSRNTKLSFAFHIQLQAFADAFSKYGYTNDETTIENPIHIDLLQNKTAGDFGYLGRKLKDGWDADYVVWNGLKALGVDSIFVGHEHCNSASVVYEGIRCQYGQKSSTYDRANFVNLTTGTIVGDACMDASDTNYVPLIGGTVIPLSEEDGAINNPYIYLCEKAGGSIDWEAYQ